ncbi:unnamed protein product, partial [Adineta ricciae]
PEANAFKGISIQCYTCDSRVTGLEGCMLFNESSPDVYKAASSSRDESCATIIGLSGQDSVTGTTYPDFAMRTFISKCVDRDWGTVSYGGATFRGRIKCCTSDLCNKENIDIPKRFRNALKGGFFIISGLLIAIGIVGGIIYLSCWRKRKAKHDSCVTNESGIRLLPSEPTPGTGWSQRGTATDYPERSAAP